MTTKQRERFIVGKEKVRLIKLVLRKCGEYRDKSIVINDLRFISNK